MATKNAQKIGWIGMGRMGFPMAERLLKAGHDVSIWNRTRAKAEPLEKLGGKVVELGRELGVPTPTHGTMYALLKPYIMGAPA